MVQVLPDPIALGQTDHDPGPGSNRRYGGRPDGALRAVLRVAGADALSPHRRSGPGRRPRSGDVRPRGRSPAPQPAALAVCGRAEPGAGRRPPERPPGPETRAAPGG